MFCWKWALTAAAAGAILSQISSVAVAAPRRDWSDYQIVIWQEETPAAYATLKSIGITAGAVLMNRATELARPNSLGVVQRAHLGFYLENIATDFYSPYHRYYEGKQPNWLYRELKDRYRRDRSDRSVFLRNPGLSDPAWLASIRNRLVANVRALGSSRPLFYNLADEPGIADLAVNWDFDFSPASLQGMRAWLRGEYGSLGALNAEWNARFAAWTDVVPETTDDAMHGHRDNFSAWADFRAWMDVAFSRAIAAGTSALHGADPQAISAIEGGQVPGEGGWDYSRLAGAVDAMELYDNGDNVEIVRSLAPQTVLLTTSFGGGPAEEHRVWRELLRGTRGLILWDDRHEFAADDGSLGVRGRQAAPYFSEIRGGLGALLMASERQLDPIAILYSQASLRLQWMLDRLPEGLNWIERESSNEFDEDNAIRIATRTSLREIEHMGLQPVFLSSQQVEQGALVSGGFRALILPHAQALSSAEAAEIRGFAARGGSVLSDGMPGIYDQHGRKLQRPLLAELFRRTPGSLTGQVSTAIRAKGLETKFPVQHTNGERAQDVETYVFDNGGVSILALLRDLPENQVPQPDGETVTVSLPHPAYAYDLRTGRALGLRHQLALSLASIAPTIIGLSDHVLPPPSLTGPKSTTRRFGGKFHITAASADDVLHLEVTDPAGRTVPAYSKNLHAANTAADFELAFAADDPVGTWTITARDLLSGHTAKVRTQLIDR